MALKNNIFIEATYKSLNKINEELCGDRVEIVRNKDGVILVLSDGLGSGVKANILSTLTSKIIATMMENGSTIEDTVETVVKTLPICNVRKIAYSTFSIVHITYEGKVRVIEFDNPKCVFLRDNKLRIIEYTEKTIMDKVIYEAEFEVLENDLFVLFSDGVIHAGLGKILDFGFSWEKVAEFLETNGLEDDTVFRTVNLLSRKCEELYLGEPGDDTTVAALKITPHKPVNIFSGPPTNPYDDEEVVMEFMSRYGKKIVCGGTSSNITSRILGEQIIMSIDYINPDIPPIAYIEGVDLVTEGVITLQKTLEILKKYYKNQVDTEILAKIDEVHAAAKLAKILIEECTHLNMFIGRRVNAAHHNPNLPIDLSARHRILDDMYNLLVSEGKVITREFY